jgi:hypothetical protein
MIAICSCEDFRLSSASAAAHKEPAVEQSVGLAPLAFGGVRETTYLQPRRGRGFFLEVGLTQFPT